MSKDKEKLKAIAASVYEEHYDMHRRGAYDFPNKTVWVKTQVERHMFNNPELYGYIWNKEIDDWELKH